MISAMNLNVASTSTIIAPKENQFQLHFGPGESAGQCCAVHGIPETRFFLLATRHFSGSWQQPGVPAGNAHKSSMSSCKVFSEDSQIFKLSHFIV
jgi:hypothetical protein